MITAIYILCVLFLMAIAFIWGVWLGCCIVIDKARKAGALKQVLGVHKWITPDGERDF